MVYYSSKSREMKTQASLPAGSMFLFRVVYNYFPVGLKKSQKGKKIKIHKTKFPNI